MAGDPLSLQEHLNRPRRQAHLDAGAGVAIGDRVEVALDVDMIVEADLAHAPLSQGIGLGRQGHQPGGVDLLEQLTTGAADVTQDALIVEPD